jgi:hypothetical protein
MLNNKRTNKKIIITNITSWIIAILWIIAIYLGIYTFVTNTQKTAPRTISVLKQESTIPEKEYTVKGKVIYTDGDLFTLATADGNEWKCCAEGYSVNDIVEITFNNNKTANIYDDNIIKLYKLNN